MQFSERMAHIKPSATLTINAKALELKSQGVDVTSLAIGEPNFPTPAHVCDAAKQAIDEGFTRYTAVPGIPPLREAIAGYFKRAYGVDVAPDCTIASNGGKQSLYNLFAALLNDGDEVIGMQLNTQGDHLLIVSANGMGKLTSIDEFKSQNRGGKGVKCYKIMEKTGNVIGVKNLHMDDEIMMINTEGIVIRMMCSDISVLGRVTSGVKLMNLSENVSVASIAKVRETSADSEDIIKKIEDEMIEDEKNDEEIKNEETTQE